jgi:hypothetical protein
VPTEKEMGEAERSDELEKFDDIDKGPTTVLK